MGYLLNPRYEAIFALERTLIRIMTGACFLTRYWSWE